MEFFDAIAICSSLSLIAGGCILLEAWCLLTEMKDRKAFRLALTLLAQFVLPVSAAWLCREGFVPPSAETALAGGTAIVTMAAAVLVALQVLVVNRHRIPDLTVYAVWAIVFAVATFLLQRLVLLSWFV